MSNTFFLPAINTTTTMAAPLSERKRVCVKRTIKSNAKVGSSGKAKFCRNCSNKHNFLLIHLNNNPISRQKKLDMKEKDINIKLDPNLAISAALKSAVTASDFFPPLLI